MRKPEYIEPSKRAYVASRTPSVSDTKETSQYMPETRVSITMPWHKNNWVERRDDILEPIKNTLELDAKMHKYYNRDFRPKQFYGLIERFFTEVDPSLRFAFFKTILPRMQLDVRNAPKLFRDMYIPVITSDIETNIALSAKQVKALITCMWFGLFDYHFVPEQVLKFMSDADMAQIFMNDNLFAFSALMYYFAADDEDHREVIFGRKSTPLPPFSDEPGNPWMRKISSIYFGDGAIDCSNNTVTVVFASKFIGDTIIMRTQESASMMVRPESYLIKLLFTHLTDLDVIYVAGAKKYIAHSGNFSLPITLEDHVAAKDDDQTIKRAMVFMDVSEDKREFCAFVTNFSRDLYKAYCAFSIFGTQSKHCVATGNWSNPSYPNTLYQLRFLQQLIAASLAGKTIVYHACSRDIEDTLTPFISWIEDNRHVLTAGRLMHVYKEAVDNFYTGEQTKFNEGAIFSAMVAENISIVDNDDNR